MPVILVASDSTTNDIFCQLLILITKYLLLRYIMYIEIWELVLIFYLLFPALQKTCFTALNHSNTFFIILVLCSQNVYSVFIYTLCKYLALFALTCSVTTATIVENCVKFTVKI